MKTIFVRNELLKLFLSFFIALRISGETFACILPNLRKFSFIVEGRIFNAKNVITIQKDLSGNSLEKFFIKCLPSPVAFSIVISKSKEVPMSSSIDIPIKVVNKIVAGIMSITFENFS